MIDGVLPEHLRDLDEAARRFALRRLAPGARAAEAEGGWPDDVHAVLAGFELPRLDVPAELGGVDAGALAKIVLLEALATGDPGGLPAADQPGPAVGALIACPDRQRAAEIFDAAVTGTGQAVLVVADPDDDRVPPVAWAPGRPRLRWAWVSRGDELRLLGAPGSVTDEPALAFAASGAVAARFEDAPVIDTWTLPPGQGSGVRGRARLWTAAVAVGIAQAAFDATVAYTTERIVFGRPVAHHQGNAFELAAAATELHAARLAVRDAAARYDAGDPHAGFWATQAWRGATNASVVVTDLGVQLLGGHGFLMDHLAEKRFREVRMLALLHGGADAAATDAAAQVLDVPDPLRSGMVR